MLFSLRNYETLRKAVSDDFERRYEFEIQSAFGEAKAAALYEQRLELIRAGKAE